MSATLPPLVLPIVGDASGLTAAFAKAQTATQQFGSRMSSSLNGVGTSFAKLGESVKGIVGPLIAAAAAYATFGAAMSALNRADELGKASAMLGITVESLQKLQVAAAQTGGSTEGMNQALREMQKTIGEAALGEDKAVAALNRLGVAASDFQGMAPDEIFYRLSDALAGTANAQDRLKISQEIFGRGARDLGETLTVGSKALREIGNEAQRYGMVMSALDNAKLKEANDAIAMMKIKMESLVSQAMVGFSESIEWISRQFVQLNARMTGTSAVVAILGGTFELLGAVVFDVFRTLNAALTAAGGAVHGLGMAFVRLSQVLYESVSVLGQWFWEALKSVAAAFEWCWQVVRIGWNGVLGFFAESIGKLTGSLGKFVSEAGAAMESFGVAGGESISKLGAKIKSWGADLPVTTKQATEEAKKIMADDVAIMSSTLSRMDGVRSTAPDWLVNLGDYFEKNFVGAAGIFNEIVSQSSIEDLVKKWMGLNATIKETSDTLGSFKAPGAGAGVGQKELDAAKQQWESFQKEIQSGNKQALGNIGTPGAAEEAEYQTKLQKLTEFNAAVIGKEKEKQDAIAQLTAQHMVAMAGVETNAREDSLKRQVENSDLSYSARVAAYESMLKMEDEKERQRADAIRAFAAANQQSEATTQAQILQNHEMFESQRTQISQQQADMRRAAEASVLGAMSSMFGAFAASMDQKQRGQFNLWKAFSIAQAIISTYLAASNAMATAGTFGPAAAIAATTMVVAAGLANVAKIASTQYGGGNATGGGSGGAASSGGGTNTGVTAANNMNPAQTNVNVSLHGDNFSAESVRSLIGLINQQQSQNMTVKVA